MNDDNSQNNNCDMVGLVGVLIQISLGILSFSILIIKRYKEQPRRPWRIWLFDTSKQLFSQLLAHFINLTISIALTYQDRSSDECLWYFTTNILDNTIGVLICVFCLITVQKRFNSNGKPQYISGNYYSMRKVVVTIDVIEEDSEDKYKKYQLKEQQNLSIDKQHSQHDTHPEILNEELDQNAVQRRQKQSQRNNGSSNPIKAYLPEDNHRIIQKCSINYKAWLVQLAVWILIVVIGKSILFGFQFGLENPIKNFTFALMGWIEDYQLLQLFVVIVIVPVIMNGFAFWIQDNFLMKKEFLAAQEKDEFKDVSLKEAHTSEHE